MGSTVMNLSAEEGADTTAPDTSLQLELHEGASADLLLTPLILKSFTLTPLTCMCAEPGMGKTYFADVLVRTAREKGLQTRVISLDDGTSESACRRMARIARVFCEKRDPKAEYLIVFDGITPPDEGEVVRERRAIAKLIEAGCKVVVCVRPEAEQLVDALPHAVVIRGDDLAFRSAGEDVRAFDLTGGIPALVEALRVDRLVGAEASRFGPRYTEMLEQAVRSSLRPALTDEERRLRLAMMLLGRGSAAELEAACGRCDLDELAWMERDVRLLGIDAHERTFACYGLSDDEAFACCAGAFQAVTADAPDLVVHTCSLLCARGDVSRAALVCKLCSSEYDYAMLACRWGAAFVQVGEVRMVADALSSQLRLEVREGVRATLSEAAVACVMGPAKEVELAKDKLEALVVRNSLEARMYWQVRSMVSCRDVCRNPQLGLTETGFSADDRTGVAMGDHLRVLRMLLEGRFEQAYAVLANEVMLREVHTVADALLALDMQVAARMSGGTLDARERELIESATRVLTRMPQSRLRRYQHALDSLLQVLMGTSSVDNELEDAIAQAERAGDAMLQSAFLTAAAVGDVRVRAFTRARVRAVRAAELAREADSEYLASSAELVCALTLELLGETGALEKYCLRKRRPRDLMMLAHLATRAAGETLGGATLPDIPLGTPCPRDSLWALNLIACDCGGLSDEVRRSMPGSWSDLLNVVRMRQLMPDDQSMGGELVVLNGAAEPRKPSLSQGEQTELVPLMTTGQRVRVRVLGGFEVRLDGEVIPPYRFERRHARDFVELLAVAPSHRMRRYQAVAAIWPEEDYFRGPRKLYEATGEARKIMGGLTCGINPIVSERSQGSVGFDRTLVSCDVDDFEREAHLTLAEDRDDFWILDHARQMCRLYADGPDEHILVLGDEAQGRLGELEDLFVDGLVAAGEAALRLGKTRLAVRYATDAHRLRDLREDAVIVLVQALRMSGRGFEVRELYQRFSRHLLEIKGVFPSLALRQVVERTLGDEPDILSA